MRRFCPYCGPRLKRTARRGIPLLVCPERDDTLTRIRQEGRTE